MMDTYDWIVVASRAETIAANIRNNIDAMLPEDGYTSDEKARVIKVMSEAMKHALALQSAASALGRMDRSAK